jgi:hypothetical protein
MFEHFTSVACEFPQPLLFTPQKSTSMEVILIFSHCAPKFCNLKTGVLTENFPNFERPLRDLQAEHQKIHVVTREVTSHLTHPLYSIHSQSHIGQKQLQIFRQKTVGSDILLCSPAPLYE